MKKRKILYLFPLAALVLSGCTFQEGWETVKNWTNDTVFTPVVDFFKGILGIENKKEDKKDEKPSGDEGGEQQQDATIKRISVESSPETVPQGGTVNPSSVMVHVYYTDGTDDVQPADEVIVDTSEPGESVEMTVKYHGVTCYTTIKVVAASEIVHVTKVSYDTGGVYTINVGETLQVNVVIEPEDATDKSVTFESNNTEVASVTASGLVTGLKAGSVGIVITSNDNPEAKKTLNLTVREDAAALPASTKAGYAKLLNGEELKNGEKINVAGAIGAQYYAMPNYTSGNNIAAKAINAEDGKLAIDAADEFEVVLNDDATVSFKQADGKYLAATGGSSANQLKVADAIGDTTKFVYSIDNDGNAQLKAKEVERGYLCLNPNAQYGSPLWSCYRAAQYEKYAIYHDGQGAEPESVTITSGDTLLVGANMTLEASVLPKEASQKVDWEIAQTAEFATLEGNVLTGKAAGTVTVTATAHGTNISASKDIQVTEPTKTLVSSITADPASIELTDGDTAATPIAITVLPQDYEEEISWSIKSGADYITLSDDHKVSAKAPGEAVVRIEGAESHVGVDVPVTVKRQLSSMKDVYDAAIAKSTATYLFRGTVTSITGKNFYIQDGDYALQVRNKDVENIALGKLVEVEATLTLYQGCPQTNAVSSAKVVGDGTAQSSAIISSKDALDALNHNVLANGVGTFVSKNKAWDADNSAQFVFKFGNDNLTVSFDKAGFASEKGEIVNAAEEGDEFTFAGLVTAAYSDVNQLSFTGTSTVSKNVYTPESVTITTTETEVLKGGQVELKASVSPEKAPQAVAWSFESGGTGAGTIVENKDAGTFYLEGTLAGTVTVKATAVGYENVTATKTFTVVEPQKVMVSSITATPDSISMKEDAQAVEIQIAVLPQGYEEDISWSIKSGEDYITLDTANHTVAPKAVGNAVVRIEGAESHVGVDVPVTVTSSKSGMQLAYEAATALANSAVSADEYTFTGIVVGKRGTNDYFVQDGDYGMDLYQPGEVAGLAVGKEVTVTAKVTKYNGTLETSKNPTVVVGETKALPNSLTIDSAATQTASKLNIRANVTGVAKNDITTTSGNTTLNLDVNGDTIAVYFHSSIRSAAGVTAVNSVKTGDTVQIVDLVTGTYNANRQLLPCEDSVVTVTPVDHSTTAIEFKADNYEVEQGASKDMSKEITLTPANSSDAVTYAVTGNEKVSINASTGVLTVAADAVVASTATVTATSGNFSDTCTITVSAATPPSTTALAAYVMNNSTASTSALSASDVKSTFFKDANCTGTNIVSSVDTANNVFKEVNALRIGSSSKKGELTLTLSQSVTKMKVRMKAYDNSAEDLKFIINGQTITITKEYAEYEITFSATTTITFSGRIATKNRGMFTNIDFYK